MNTKERLEKVLLTIIGDDKAKRQKIMTKEDLDFFNDLEFDSTDIMMMIVEIEKEFDMDIIGDDNFVEIVENYATLLKWLEMKSKKVS